LSLGGGLLARSSAASAATITVVMAITKCRIWVPPVNRFTGAERELRQCGRTSDGWSALACMEKIMRKTNDTSCCAAATSERELTVDQLDAVVGGTTAYVPHTYAIGRIEARFPRI
jgi:hypothetical protein